MSAGAPRRDCRFAPGMCRPARVAAGAEGRARPGLLPERIGIARAAV